MPTTTPKTAAKMPRTALVPPRAGFDDVSTELAGSLTGVDALERMVPVEMVVLDGEELEEEIDVTPNNSDVLVDSKVQKHWTRVSDVKSSFGNRA